MPGGAGAVPKPNGRSYSPVGVVAVPCTRLPPSASPPAPKRAGAEPTCRQRPCALPPPHGPGGGAGGARTGGEELGAAAGVGHGGGEGDARGGETARGVAAEPGAAGAPSATPTADSSATILAPSRVRAVAGCLVVLLRVMGMTAR